jgi:hypothetical protein
MTLRLGEINWLAVLVTAAAMLMLGGAWYTALFGRAWVGLHGYTPEQIKAMQARRPPPVFFGGMFAAYFLASFVIALLAASFGVRGAAAGAMLGFLLWLGVALALGLTDWLAADKPVGVLAINASFQLVILVGAGALLASWR